DNWLNVWWHPSVVTEFSIPGNYMGKNTPFMATRFCNCDARRNRVIIISGRFGWNDRYTPQCQPRISRSRTCQHRYTDVWWNPSNRSHCPNRYYIKAGAVSPFSGILQSVFVLAILLLFAPYASSIPLASMAPILMVVAFNMSEYKSFMHILKLKSSDSLVLATTFLLTVFVNLTVAVPVGLLLAMISFIKRMGEVLEVKHVTPDVMKEKTNHNGEK